MLKDKYQLIVIGAGPGGYAAAFHAADLGMDVALIDTRPEPGGVCLYEGCIPSKALLHVTGIMDDAVKAGDMGLKFEEPQVDIKKMAKWKKSVVKGLTGGLLSLSKARKVQFIQGKAKFKHQHEITIEGKNLPSGQTLQFEYAIVATGSVPAELPFAGIDGKKIIDAAGALELKDVPEQMLVVGGGYIGLEMGTVYSALGSKVTVAEMEKALLPGVDRDLVGELNKSNQKRFKDTLTNTRVTNVKSVKSGKLRVEMNEGGKPKQISVDKILLAIGRKPNAHSVAPEQAGLDIDDKGFFAVDEHRQTNIPHIYAIGDVATQPMLAHKATYEGKIAAESISGAATIYDPASVPAVVFTNPEIAWCGMTENEANEVARNTKIVRYPWTASGRASTTNSKYGLTKMIIDPVNHQILGVGIAGKNAGELIAEAVVAIEMGATADDLSMSIHPHPTFSETLMEAAESIYGGSTHYKGKS